MGGKSKNLPVPPVYSLLVLCRDIFHCTPADLMKQDWALVAEMAHYHNIEIEMRNAKKETLTR